jgi:hypothetical protein
MMKGPPRRQKIIKAESVIHPMVMSVEELRAKLRMDMMNRAHENTRSAGEIGHFFS